MINRRWIYGRQFLPPPDGPKVVAQEYALDDSDMLVPISRSPGLNTCGMVVWKVCV